MGHTLYATPSFGVIIYENSDDAPLSDPFAYRNRVLLYSGWRYPARVATYTGTVSFAAGDSGAIPEVVSNRSHTLFAHGLGTTPLLMEGVWLGIGTGGADVPMIGSVPVQVGSSFNYRTRWAALGADATHVYIHEQHNNSSFGGGALPAVTIGYEVHILNFLATANTVLEFTPTLFRTLDFSSANRYIRAVASGGYALATGITCNTVLSAPTGTGSERAQWHYTIPGIYDKSFVTNVQGGNSDPGAPSPTVQRVTI